MVAEPGGRGLAWAAGCYRAVESERVLGLVLDHIGKNIGRENMLRLPELSASQAAAGLGLLSVAVWTNNQGVVAALLARGADVNEPGGKNGLGDSGWTPLHWAMATGRMDLVAVLIRAGADPTLKSGKGATPEDVLGAFLREEVMRDLAVSYLTVAKAGYTKDVNALVRGAKAHWEGMGRGFASKVAFNVPIAPPPPGWNGLEEALKKRAALTAKPAGSKQSKTPAKPSSKPSYMTAPSAR